MWFYMGSHGDDELAEADGDGDGDGEGEGSTSEGSPGRAADSSITDEAEATNKTSHTAGADESGCAPLRPPVMREAWPGMAAWVGTVDAKGRTRLHTAAKKGDVWTVKALIGAGADVHAVDMDKMTPLHLAVMRNRAEIVRYLLAHSDARVDAASVDSGLTPLMFAVRNKRRRGQGSRLPMVHALLGGGADVNAVGPDGFTALYHAARRSEKGLAQALIDAGADVNSARRVCGSEPVASCPSAPLQNAVEFESPAVRDLLAAGADVDAVDESGWSALYSAARHGLPSMAQVLIAAGASMSIVSRKGLSPLHIASRHGHVETVRVLLTAGADVSLSMLYAMDARDWVCDALAFAASNGHTAVVDLLVAAGADVEGPANGCPPLGLAAGSGRIDVVRLLLSQCANVNSEDEYGKTALVRAAHFGHVGCARLLLAAGAEVRDSLMHAAFNGHCDIIRFLAAAGADVNAQWTPRRWTALIEAACAAQASAIAALLENGADPEICSSLGVTALRLAVDRGHAEASRALLDGGVTL